VNPTYIDLRKSLRAVRKSKGLTLREVEARSNGRFRAVTLGTWERGDRVISLSQALDLAEFYEIPLAELLGITPQPLRKDIADAIFNLISEVA
jgi:transcriptional regulator with XRE-family HTH domain